MAVQVLPLTVIIAGCCLFSVSGAGDSTEVRTSSPMCSEPPRALCEKLLVRREPSAVFDQSTGEWHVALTCGVLTNRGAPPVDVLWTTPSGTLLPSTSHSDGDFRLLLANPVTGGTYTCQLHHQSSAATQSPPVLEPAEIYIDTFDSRMLVYEAELKALRNKGSHSPSSEKVTSDPQTAQLEKELTALQQKTKELAGESNRLKEEADGIRTEQTTLSDADESITERISALKNKNRTGESSWQNLTVKVSTLEGWARQRVSFTVHGLNQTYISAYSQIPLTGVVEDIDKAYDAVSGSFTAPVDGLYFVAATAAIASVASKVPLYIGRRTVGVCLFTSQHPDNMGFCQGVSYLKAGQTLSLGTIERDARLSPELTSFTGFLIAQDYHIA